MADLERLSQIAMEIIAYSGVAKSTYIEAARLAREGDFEQAQEQILQGDEVLKTAHETHMQLLQKEAAENTPQVSMLVLHAEDQFMSCETIKVLVLEIIEIYKTLGKEA